MAATSRCRCIADAHGNVVHLYERDCSAQRRHQKVLEEAPASATSATTYAARSPTQPSRWPARSGYVSAGTVEFLVSRRRRGLLPRDEHPTAGRASRHRAGHRASIWCSCSSTSPQGEPLPFGQDDVVVRGHAIEARVYAEDSFGGFLPQAGAASIVRWPGGFEVVASATSSTSDTRIRVDAALEPRGVVSTAYDPMLGKVIAHGPDRESARQALVAALDDTVILGLTTNAGFLRALVASDEFRDATIDTAWLDHHDVPAPDPEVPRILAAWVSAMLASFGPPHPFQSDGFRLGGPPATDARGARPRRRRRPRGRHRRRHPGPHALGREPRHRGAGGRPPRPRRRQCAADGRGRLLPRSALRLHSARPPRRHRCGGRRLGHGAHARHRSRSSRSRSAPRSRRARPCR